MDRRSYWVRERAHQEAFIPADPLDVDGDFDDGFERSALSPAGAHARHIGSRQLAARAQTFGDLLPTGGGGRLAGAIALVVLAGLLVGVIYPALPANVLTSLAQMTAASAPEFNSTFTAPFTAFDGWRIAYAGDNGRLYVAAPDGSSTLAGPALPNLRLAGDSSPAATSPDGHRIAYVTRTSGLTIVDVTGAPAKPHVIQVPAAGTDFFWSPDGTRVATTTVEGAIATIDARSGRLSVVPGTLAPASLRDLGGVTLVGWSDASHLVVARRELATGNTALDMRDAQTGLSHPLAALPALGSFLRFALAPDGSKILAYGSASVAEGSTRSPAVWVIDCTTGSVRSLPGVEHSLDSPLVAAVWDADLTTLVAATRVALPASASGAVMHDWILYTEGDFAVSQKNLGVPLGWMAGTGTVIFGAWDPSAGGAQSYGLLRALTYTLRGATTLRQIYGASGNLLFLGFVRTR